MKSKFKLLSFLLGAYFVLYSCSATTKYSSEIAKNNYSNLRTGKTYSFKMNDGSSRQKMVFTRVTKDSIIGMANKKDSTIVAVAKSNVIEAKDVTQSTINTTALVIGGTAAAALGVIISRTDYTETK